MTRMLRATLFARCPNCLEGPLFRGPFALRDRCGRCHTRLVGGPGEWLGPTMLAYGVGVVTAAACGVVVVRRVGFFPGITVALVAVAVLGALVSLRFVKAWWVWLLWRTGQLPIEPDVPPAVN